MPIQQLGYVGIEVRDPGRWTTLLTDALGLAAAGSSGQWKSFRMDQHAHRILIFKSERDDLAFVGLQVDSPAGLESLTSRLRQEGFDVTDGSRQEAAIRRVRRFVWLPDPDGLRIELYVLPDVSSEPFVPGRAISGFKADRLGLGHVVITASDRDALESFYVNLGMRVTDYGGGILSFLRCNPRHHSIALFPRDQIGSPSRIVHIMLEMQSLDDVGTTLDACQRLGTPITKSLGKHTNDGVTSFYLGTPSGFELECGYGGRLVDEDTWEMAHYPVRDLWGHHPLT